MFASGKFKTFMIGIQETSTFLLFRKQNQTRSEKSSIFFYFYSYAQTDLLFLTDGDYSLASYVRLIQNKYRISSKVIYLKPLKTYPRLTRPRLIITWTVTTLTWFSYTNDLLDL